MELSKRLEAVVALVPTVPTVCDVGCDHGYVAITLLQRGIAERVIAMDVNAGPLEQAKKNAALYKMTEKLQFRLSDGLAGVKPGEADAFLLAGMGGRLMVRIMKEGRAVMEQMRGAVLQPQSELSFVRRYIYESGWHIVKEDMVFEADGALPDEGKYYPMMYIEPGEAVLPTETELLYGPLLLKEKHPMLRQFFGYSLRHREALLQQLKEQCANGKAAARAEELLQEIAQLRTLYMEMQA